MASLDPNAQAAAYLDRLAPTLRLAASAHTLQAHWSGVVGGVLAVLACWLVLKTGVLIRLRRGIERERPRPWLATAAAAAVFVFLFALLMAPWGAFVAWRQALVQPGRAFDLAGYAGGAGRAQLAPLVAATILLSLVYAALRRAPRTWWAWGGGAAAGLAIVAVWLPYALAAGPAALPVVPPGPARDGLVALIRDARLPAGEVYVSPGAAPDADVTGTPFLARVVVSKGMLEQATPAEIRAAVGHLAGHFHYGDELSLAVVLGLLTLGGLYAAHRLFAPVTRLMGGRGLQGPADPAGLPVLTAIAFVWLGLATVAFNGFDRLINVRADQYSLDHAREPDGLATSLLRDWRGEKVDPSAIEEALFYDHPSLQHRVLHAMTWKAGRRP